MQLAVCSQQTKYQRTTCKRRLVVPLPAALIPGPRGPCQAVWLLLVSYSRHPHPRPGGNTAATRQPV